MEEAVDVVVIGAGPAGSIAAAGLLKHGKSVVVLERDEFPRFVIGESLLPRTNEILNNAGLLEDVEKFGFMRKEGAVFIHQGKKGQFNFAESTESDWDHSFQVPRADFDQILANGIIKKGADVRFRHQVNNVVFDDSSVEVFYQNLNDGKLASIKAKFIIDASGYGRVLPRLLDLDEVSDLKFRITLFAHIEKDIRPQGAAEGYIWIVALSDNAWVWVIPFSNGKTSVGVVGDQDVIDDLQGSDEDKFRQLIQQEPLLAERLQDMLIHMPVKRLEGYSVGVKQLFGDRYILTGNATEFLDPIFSSGVTVAVESAWRAQDVVNRYIDGEAVDFQKEYADYLMIGVNCFRDYVKSWYKGELNKIFHAENENSEIKRSICSVLAGYAWNEKNKFVSDTENALSTTLTLINAYK